MVLSIVALLAFGRQDAMNWQPDRARAEATAERDGLLVAAWPGNLNEKLSEKQWKELDNVEFLTESKKFVWFKSTVRDDSILLSDSEGRPRGHLSMPFDSKLFSRFCEAARISDQRHEALLFRSKGRIDALGTAQLAFSYASRRDAAKSANLISSLLSQPRVEGLDLAMVECAECFTLDKSISQAEDMWTKLMAVTKDSGIKATARLALGRLWLADQKDRSKSMFESVSESRELGSIYRWYAQEQLQNLDSLGRSLQ